jgi:hypothetical protein
LAGAPDIDWSLVLSAVQTVALATVAVAFIAVLWRTRAIARTAGRAVAASRRAARAADRRARAAEAALSAQQRAWLAAESLALTRPTLWVDGRLDARLELCVRNTGLARARMLSVRLEPAASADEAVVEAFVHGGAAFFDARPRRDARAADFGIDEDAGATTETVRRILGPGLRREIGSGDETARDAVAEIAPGQVVARAVRLASPEVGLRHIAPGGLTVFGRLDYEDGAGQRRATRFAFQLANRDGAWRFDPRPGLGAAD